jgi:hypothetical protein
MAMRGKTLIIISGLFLSILACTSMRGTPFIDERIPLSRKGYTVGSVVTRAGSFETAPYIPTKIAFELKEMLRLEGRLTEDPTREKTIMVFIETDARYMGGGSRNAFYSELESRVFVLDFSDGCYSASAEIKSFNGFGPVLSDFTERSHAKETLDFLLKIIR